MKVKDWTVGRAFKGLVVTGLDHRGRDVKFDGVAAVTVKGGKVVAVDGAGKKHELLLPAAEPAAGAA